jgi:hypothetical protein
MFARPVSNRRFFQKKEKKCMEKILLLMYTKKNLVALTVVNF